MAKLYGAQRMVLQAILDAQGETPAFIEDSRICQATRISLRDIRDWFLTLDNDELVDLALTENGMNALGYRQGTPGSRSLSTVTNADPADCPRAIPIQNQDRSGESAGHRYQRLPSTDPEASRRRQ